MSPVSAPADRHFRRARVKPVRRRRRWLKGALTVFSAAALAAGASAGAYALASVVVRARVLEIDRIDVRGNQRMSDEDVAAVLEDLRGEHILWTDLEMWRQRLMAAPWVLEASVRRTLPSTIEVAMTERRPIGFARLDSRLYLIDEHGVVIDEQGPAYADLDLPIIDGLDVDRRGRQPGAEEAGPNPDAARLAARVIAALGQRQDIGRRLSQVNVRDRYNASVMLSDDPAVLHLGEERFLERVLSYLELAEWLRQRYPEIEYVDLRIEDRVILRPAVDGRRGSVVPASAVGARRRD